MKLLCLILALFSAWLGTVTRPHFGLAAGPAASSSSTEQDADLPVYKPKNSSTPRARIGGLPRGQHTDGPVVVALVPDHVGFTMKSDPSLCWFLSQETSLPLVLTVIEERGIRPVLDVSFPRPGKAGVRCANLKDHGLTLKQGEQYRWSIALVVDPEQRSRDIVSGGMIERMAFDEACALGLPCSWWACEREAINRYAEAGLWYDAVSCLQELLQHTPGDRGLATALTRLLEQAEVPLPEECFREDSPCMQLN